MSIGCFHTVPTSCEIMSHCSAEPLGESRTDMFESLSVLLCDYTFFELAKVRLVVFTHSPESHGFQWSPILPPWLKVNLWQFQFLLFWLITWVYGTYFKSNIYYFCVVELSLLKSGCQSLLIAEFVTRPGDSWKRDLEKLVLLYTWVIVEVTT